MSFKLRPYQQMAVDKTIAFVKKSYDSCLLELATGAGKSLIVAEIAKILKDISGKKVLCLAPSKELVEQNREKYLSYGEPASMFSASAGQKCLRHNVIFGSPQTVLNGISKFGSNFAAIVIDEAHGVTPTIKKIVTLLKELNPKVRVIGLTATPYRLGSGYIYEINENNEPLPETQTKNPFFKKLLYRVSTDYLIDAGFLTPVIAEEVTGYDTSGLEIKNGKFTNESIEQAFEGYGRKTADIVAQVVELSMNRRGVMFFAATRQHASEIMASLPESNARIVLGGTPKKEREKIINDFKAQKFKYLVNVSVLTTGFDAPHVDVVAILRSTESAGLLQQIIGRGLRLYNGKKNCLLLDYAENIERHQLEDNLFKPEIAVSISTGESFEVKAECPVCATQNIFAGRPNKENYEIDENGYFIDLAGNHIIESEKPLPGHFGRRCLGQSLVKGKFEQCNYRWSFKECPECDTENDIAARYCKECRAELVDPNEKLKLDFKKMKRSPHLPSSDKVVSWFAQSWVSQRGNESLRVDYTTEYRTFSAWYTPDSRTSDGQFLWHDLCVAVFGKTAPNIDKFIKALKKGYGKMPETITSKKDGNFFKIIAHNRPEDVLNEI